MTMFPAIVLYALVAITEADNYVDQKVVPDVFPNSPLQKLSVIYGDVSADEGNELTPTQTKSVPEVKWEPSEGVLYTLIMSDPDALVVVNPFLHWLIVNIQGSDVSTGTELAGYFGIGPQPGTGAHRYVFSVWAQNCTLTPDDYVVPGKTASNSSMIGRVRFDTTAYAKKITGEENPTPVAGNFFKSSFDDYVKTVLGHFEEMMKKNE